MFDIGRQPRMSIRVGFTVTLSVRDGITSLSGDGVTPLLRHLMALLPGHVATHLLGHRGALLAGHLPRHLLAVLLGNIMTLLLGSGHTLLHVSNFATFQLFVLKAHLVRDTGTGWRPGRLANLARYFFATMS